MTSKLQVIYIPGLGDSKIHQRFNGQRLLVSTWRLWGVVPHIFQVNWADKEPFAPKFERLLKYIDTISQNQPVGVVSSSAGASAMLNLWAARPEVIKAAVSISGKINYPETIGSGYRSKNPAFAESAQQSAASLTSLTLADRKRLLSIYAAADEIVPAKDSIVTGAHNRRAWSMGHAVTIALQLSFGAPRFLHFIKSAQR